MDHLGKTIIFQNIILRYEIVTCNYLGDWKLEITVLVFGISFCRISFIFEVPVQNCLALPQKQCEPSKKLIHSVPHNSNSLISNYRLFRRLPSAPKIAPLIQC